MRKRIKIDYFGLKNQFLKLKRELACSNKALQSTKKHLPIKTKLFSLSVTYYPVILLNEISAVLSISIEKKRGCKISTCCDPANFESSFSLICSHNVLPATMFLDWKPICHF